MSIKESGVGKAKFVEVLDKRVLDVNHEKDIRLKRKVEAEISSVRAAKSFHC